MSRICQPPGSQCFSSPFVSSHAHVSLLAGRLDSSHGLLESLADAEVEPPAACLRLAVHEQTWDRVELVADVEANRPNRRLISKTGAYGVAEIVEHDAAGILPDVSRVHEQHHAEPAVQRHASFLADEKHAVAA